MIHHYTSIDTLALILATGNIRFNRLDRVDDTQEIPTIRSVNLSPYFFVSCWTKDQVESIPQWHMYTDSMSGVRISLPDYPFEDKEMSEGGLLGLEKQGEIYSPLSLREIITDDYFIVPSFLDKGFFAKDVIYVEDVESEYGREVNVAVEDSGQANLRFGSKVGAMKSMDWSFQKEFRFRLQAFPSPSLPHSGKLDGSFFTDLPRHIMNCIFSGVAPTLDYIDLKLSKKALDSIVVTTGPLCSQGGRLAVDALVQKYSRGGVVKESSLSGSIRKPTR